MQLKLRELCLDNNRYRFLTILLIGLYTQLIVISILTLVFRDISVNKFIISADSIINIYSFGIPLSTIVFLYLVMKFIETNNPYIISLLVGLISTTVVFLFEISIDGMVNPLKYISDIPAIAILIFVWLVLLQSDRLVSKALSIGYFGFLITGLFIGLVRVLITNDNISFPKIVGSFMVSIIIAGLLSVIFESFVRVTARVLRLKL